MQSKIVVAGLLRRFREESAELSEFQFISWIFPFERIPLRPKMRSASPRFASISGITPEAAEARTLGGEEEFISKIGYCFRRLILWKNTSLVLGKVIFKE